MDLPQRHRDTEINDLNAVSARIIGCAIEVHRALGPGLLESLYESALCIELEANRMSYVRQMRLPVVYKGRTVGIFRIDLVVAETVVVEIKCADSLHPIFEAQLLTYLRLTGKRLGLILNFNSALMKNGIKRLVL